MGGKASRDKGKAWEREVARRMRELFPLSAEQIKRGWQARSGADAADVVGLPYGLWVEAKAMKQVGLRAALEQAEEASAHLEEDALPIVVAKDDRRKPVIMMRLDAFETLVNRIREE